MSNSGIGGQSIPCERDMKTVYQHVCKPYAIFIHDNL